VNIPRIGLLYGTYTIAVPVLDIHYLVVIVNAELNDLKYSVRELCVL
jgi:hypothetical protein